nr:hypothetical protein KPHV_86830 [Kitasatospora purpeofusca]
MTFPVPSRRARVCAVCLAALACTGLSAPPAAAHTGLNSSDPADAATLAAWPARVRLSFTDPMSQPYSKIAVTGPDGRAYGLGEVQVEGTAAALDLAPSTAPGRYQVGYRVVSKDGHPVTGTVTFTYTPTAPSPAAAVPPAPSPQPPTPTPTPSPGTAADAQPARKRSGISIPQAAGAGLLALAAAAGVFALRRRQVRHAR